MANIGTGTSGFTVIGQGNGQSPTFAAIGTSSGLTSKGVVLSQNNSAFQASNAGTNGQLLIGATGANPAFASITSSDGSITATAGANSLDLKANGVVNPSLTAQYFDDCFNSVVWDMRANGTASATGQSATFVDHPGVFVLTTGTDTGGKCSSLYSYIGNNTPNWLPGGTGTFTYQASIMIGTLANVTDDFLYFVGPADGWVFGNPGNGIYFEYNRSSSANWLSVSANSSSFTTVDSGVAVSTNWVNFMIVGNNSSVDYYINGVNVATINTNLPTNPVNINMTLITKTAGTTSVNVYQDYFYFSQAVSR